jgi:hypothetical protein
MTKIYDVFFYGTFVGYVWARSAAAAVESFARSHGYDDSPGLTANASY